MTPTQQLTRQTWADLEAAEALNHHRRAVERSAAGADLLVVLIGTAVFFGLVAGWL